MRLDRPDVVVLRFNRADVKEGCLPHFVRTNGITSGIYLRAVVFWTLLDDDGPLPSAGDSVCTERRLGALLRRYECGAFSFVSVLGGNLGHLFVGDGALDGVLGCAGGVGGRPAFLVFVMNAVNSTGNLRRDVVLR